MIPLGILASARHAPTGGGGGGLTYQTDVTQSGTAATTRTFIGVPFGAASAARTVVVAVAWRTGEYWPDGITSVTIAGVPATLDVMNANASPEIVTGIFRATVPTGTTGDVVVVGAKGSTVATIGVWSSGAAVAPMATARSASPNTATSIASAAGDEVVAIAGSNAYNTTISGVQSRFAHTSAGGDATLADSSAITISATGDSHLITAAAYR